MVASSDPSKRAPVTAVGFVDQSGKRVGVADVIGRLAAGSGPVILQLRHDQGADIDLDYQAVSALKRRFNAVAAAARLNVTVERLSRDHIAVRALEPRMTADRVRTAMDDPPDW